MNVENNGQPVDDDVNLTAYALGEISDPVELRKIKELLKSDGKLQAEFQATAKLASLIRESVDSDLPMAPGSLHDLVVARLSEAPMGFDEQVPMDEYGSGETNTSETEAALEQEEVARTGPTLEKSQNDKGQNDKRQNDKRQNDKRQGEASFSSGRSFGGRRQNVVWAAISLSLLVGCSLYIWRPWEDSERGTPTNLARVEGETDERDQDRASRNNSREKSSDLKDGRFHKENVPSPNSESRDALSLDAVKLAQDKLAQDKLAQDKLTQKSSSENQKAGTFSREIENASASGDDSRVDAVGEKSFLKKGMKSTNLSDLNQSTDGKSNRAVQLSEGPKAFNQAAPKLSAQDPAGMKARGRDARGREGGSVVRESVSGKPGPTNVRDMSRSGAEKKALLDDGKYANGKTPNPRTVVGKGISNGARPYDIGNEREPKKRLVSPEMNKQSGGGAGAGLNRGSSGSGSKSPVQKGSVQGGFKQGIVPRNGLAPGGLGESEFSEKHYSRKKALSGAKPENDAQGSGQPDSSAKSGVDGGGVGGGLGSAGNGKSAQSDSKGRGSRSNSSPLPSVIQRGVGGVENLSKKIQSKNKKVEPGFTSPEDRDSMLKRRKGVDKFDLKQGGAKKYSEKESSEPRPTGGFSPRSATNPSSNDSDAKSVVPENRPSNISGAIVPGPTAPDSTNPDLRKPGKSAPSRSLNMDAENKLQSAATQSSRGASEKSKSTEARSKTEESKPADRYGDGKDGNSYFYKQFAKNGPKKELKNEEQGRGKTDSSDENMKRDGLKFKSKLDRPAKLDESKGEIKPQSEESIRSRYESPQENKREKVVDQSPVERNADRKQKNKDVEGVPERIKDVEDAKSSKLADDQKDVETDKYEYPTPEYENEFVQPLGTDALSTFSIDTDTASYSYVRQMLNSGKRPQVGSVRIEEMVNYFDYQYAPPQEGKLFSVNLEVGAAPWAPGNKLLRVGMKAREIANADRPPSNLVFLIDVSGSMRQRLKLPLLQSGMKSLVDQLREDDYVSIVTYSNDIKTPLQPTDGSQKEKIKSVIDSLVAKGSTNGSGGLEEAYQLATRHFLKKGVNRIVMGTDGDFNVGIQKDEELIRFIKEKAEQSKVFLTICGFGTDNFRDTKVQKMAQNGNGKVYYIDSAAEAEKVFVENISGGLVNIAKDVKIQVLFNPRMVQAYRLIGYENRMLQSQDFGNDKKDAGEIGAGDNVTALYEIVPADKDFSFPTLSRASRSIDLKYQVVEEQKLTLTKEASKKDIAALRIRYKKPDSSKSTLEEFVVENNSVNFNRSSKDLQFASSVAGFGMLLRGSRFRGTLNFDGLYEMASGAVAGSKDKHRHEFLELIKKAKEVYRASR